MYLSRVQLLLNNLSPQMLHKWNEVETYASHQWLWQLFPEQESRHFLFRQEPRGRFFLLSATPPLAEHPLFIVETRAFKPQLEKGALLDFQLRANPVVTRNKKRSDVMMDAKYQAKERGENPESWRPLQRKAAQSWLVKQGEQHGFSIQMPEPDDFSQWAGVEYVNGRGGEDTDSDCVKAWQQHRFARKSEEKPVIFSSVDYAGTLCITDISSFEHVLFNGLGKSKALGCGMLMVKRRR
ncbi:type I-E CRISPR-associated protein Cas6/Cse3/CasE [Phytobacter ursingii]|uniref:type I-E CRISPR-associated protein Cas6/Cse3/CasE n=1 Tax=Phytobacter ursingii TaxID=1972431 RepID=UPI000CD3203E|nr:type I-E CRISPR-associated protein Cas6/Cse3/CasE [Enterobacteriaceae bacterium ENNIH1]RDT52827.1 type I-E CRISPR-associated protein Cas6/Cse3/CasE [Escherichia coli]